MGILRKKKKSDDELPTKNDVIQKEENPVDNYENQINELNEKIARLRDMSMNQRVQEIQQKEEEEEPPVEEEPNDENPEDIKLIISALANSDEYQLYKKVIIGKKVEQLILAYQERLKQDVLE